MKMFAMVALACLPATSRATPLLGYGSSDAVIPAKDQELFYTGFEAGFEATFGKRIPKDLIAIDTSYDGTQTGAAESAKRLLKRGVKILIGFPTSHEALLVAPIAQASKSFALFPAASHSSIASYGPMIYSTGESMETGVIKALSFIKSHFPNQEGQIIYNPSSVYSNDQKEIFDRMVKTVKYSDLRLKFLPVRNQQALGPEQLKQLKNNPPSFLYFTQYASEATDVLEQLERLGIDKPILANSSWPTGGLEFTRRFLAARKSPLYSVGLWIKGNRRLEKLNSLVRNKYGIEATPEIVHGFDLGVIVATVYKDIETVSYISPAVFREAFVKRRCFEGTSAGKLCFGSQGGHAEREVEFVQFTKSGFVGVK